MGKASGGRKTQITINADDVHEKLDAFKELLEDLGAKNASKLKGRVYGRALERTYTRVRKVIGQEGARHYRIKVSTIKASARRHRIRQEGQTVGMVIYMEGTRLKLGSDFKVKNSRARRLSRPRKGSMPNYVKANILQGVQSVLKRTNNAAGAFFVRDNKVFHRSKTDVWKTGPRGGKYYKVERVNVGIAAPQTAMNRAAPEILNQGQTVLMERIEHEINYELDKIAKRK